MNIEQIHRNIEQLIIQGKKFTYESFLQKTRSGAISVVEPKWTVWVESVLQELQAFPKEGGVIDEYNKGKSINLIGYHENKFEEAKQAYLASLQLAIINLPNINIKEKPLENPERNSHHDFQQNTAILKINLANLRELILERFSQGEIIDICWELGIDHEALNFDEKKTLSREIITHLQRRDKLHILILKVILARPNQDWNKIFLI